jgi:precorrin-2 dehydrogenase/sirohydrochlorin ferrochelatase
MAYLPIFVDVTASPCAVIGGGEVAERKVRGLVERGAEVTVISASASEEIATLAASGAIRWNRRPWRSGDLAGFEMVFCALNDPEAARMAAAEARKLGIPINVADQPELCTFIAPAVVRRGDLQIAISTSGASPALAARIRAALEREFGAEYAAAIIVLRAARAFVREREPDVSERSRRLGALVERDIAAIIRTGDGAALDRALRETVGADLAELGIAHVALMAPAPARTRPYPE